MALILWLIGAACVIEGLVLALAPSRIPQLLALIAAMTVSQRRMAGLAALAAGVALLWLARSLGFGPSSG
ncbi:hypothetical protein IQ03_02567 [Gemmobacter caeni]|uniref:Uncharacterized protein n=1 Tax=Gemmobacter caeni TaxID=589035 RepID=A0A2T6AYS2_9RHOB|nr:DUF2065 family protein [Gemmobacter caeni]OJY35167.1 MAG: hypothetical protein BGP11_00395 [Rhodobacterales bacterium 65-51]PTX48961.1 hypothetical protein C8N34_10867 [Gemmobacter caeni]TWI99038.1 hypothetical protein IQ03_02567 [Gemmobacter caeni]